LRREFWIWRFIAAAGNRGGCFVLAPSARHLCSHRRAKKIPSSVQERHIPWLKFTLQRVRYPHKLKLELQPTMSLLMELEID
jgi:hypothetical protein